MTNRLQFHPQHTLVYPECRLIPKKYEKLVLTVGGVLKLSKAGKIGDYLRAATKFQVPPGASREAASAVFFLMNGSDGPDCVMVQLNPGLGIGTLAQLFSSL